MKVDVVIGAIGILILAHAAHLTISYRGVLKLKGEEFSFAPPQVLAEVFLSVLLCFWAALRVPGTFLPILPDSKENRVVALPANLDFMMFNHRGKLFPPALESKFPVF
ncbi:unnamed protein product [Calypogeia fissa]